MEDRHVAPLSPRLSSTMKSGIDTNPVHSRVLIVPWRSTNQNTRGHNPNGNRHPKSIGSGVRRALRVLVFAISPAEILEIRTDGALF